MGEIQSFLLFTPPAISPGPINHRMVIIFPRQSRFVWQAPSQATRAYRLNFQPFPRRSDVVGPTNWEAFPKFIILHVPMPWVALRGNLAAGLGYK